MGIVVAEGLRKRYGNVRALRGVDLDVPRGTVTGLLGPNGAGKTTAVRILSTLLRPDTGRVEIDGVDALVDPRGARTRIGLTGQFAAVDERLTTRENLAHIGRLLHLPRGEVRRRADILVDRFDLGEAADRPAQTYSGGMRRRLDIAMSLIGDPPVLFLDEPTTGLDPRSRLAVWDLVSELTDYGTTVLLTTQYLDEADRLADRIVVVDHGRVIARGAPVELKRQVGADRVLVQLAPGADAKRATEVLAACAVGEIRLEDGVLAVPVSGVEGVVPDVVRALDRAGVGVRDVGARPATLDDVFFALTGHVATSDLHDDPADTDAEVARA